jgi:glycosyltransferase involved in cell wall biosynthesis
VRIAIVSQGLDTILPPRQNSVGLCTWALARHLGSDKNHITAFGCAAWGGQASRSSVDGADFHIFPSSLLDKILEKAFPHYSAFMSRFMVGHRVKPYSASWWCSPIYILMVGRALRSEKPDIIHIQHSIQFAPILKLLNRRARVVVQLQAAHALPAGSRSVRRNLKSVDAILGVSNYVLDDFIRCFPDFNGTIGTVHDGIDEQEFPESKESHAPASHKLLFLAHISPHKGVHDVISAFAEIADVHPGLQLDIVGPPGAYPLDEIAPIRDHETRERLLPFYGEHGQLSTAEATNQYLELLNSLTPAALADRVHLLGHLTREEVLAHLTEADVFVFPPLWDEGFGLPVVEAMASGTPVVATRSGAVVETVTDGVTGYLVEKGDTTAIADAVHRLLSDDDLRRGMGKAARTDAIRRFSWKVCARDALDIYHRLLDDAEPPDLPIQRNGKPAEGRHKLRTLTISTARGAKDRAAERN